MHINVLPMILNWSELPLIKGVLLRNSTHGIIVDVRLTRQGDKIRCDFTALHGWELVGVPSIPSWAEFAFNECYISDDEE